MVEPVLEVLNRALKDRDLNLAIKAARDVLNRTGHAAPLKVQADVHLEVAREERFKAARQRNQLLLNHATTAELDEMSEICARLEERARAAGDLPPAEPKRAPLPLNPEVALARMGHAAR